MGAHFTILCSEIAHVNYRCDSYMITWNIKPHALHVKISRVLHIYIHGIHEIGVYMCTLYSDRSRNAQYVRITPCPINIDFSSLLVTANIQLNPSNTTNTIF